MPRGKNTNVYLSCKNKKGTGSSGKTAKNDEICNMQNYKIRINKKTRNKLEIEKFCSTCNAKTPHVSGSEIKHSS
ncbi:50S ribosomal protein L33 [Candidatus Parvarchaeota archaeon]|nr:50S ribosomal protein L33 [Candidatus Parvarchaeota archaeon]